MYTLVGIQNCEKKYNVFLCMSDRYFLYISKFAIEWIDLKLKIRKVCQLTKKYYFYSVSQLVLLFFCFSLRINV